MAHCLEALAAVAATRQPALALACLGKAQRLYEETGIRLSGTDSRMHEETAEVLRATVGSICYETALAEDRLLPMEDAIVEIEAWNCD